MQSVRSGRSWLVIALILISAAGFLDAVYLSAKHYLGDPVVCTVLGGCEEVTTSEYSTIFGVSIALLGALYYLLVFAFLYLYREGERHFIKLAAYLTGAGFIASLYLVYVQAFVLKAFCFYCLVSALSTTLLFIGSAWATIKERSL